MNETLNSPKLKTRSQAEDGDAVFFGADTRQVVNKVLGKLRNAFAEHFKLKIQTLYRLAWIVDFPFYEMDEKTGKMDFGHNPFSMPKGGLRLSKIPKISSRLWPTSTIWS
jgi:aspartyl-tRNA synthetase